MNGRTVVLVLTGETIKERLLFAGMAGSTRRVTGAYGTRELVKAMMFAEGSEDLRFAEETLSQAGFTFEREYIGAVGHG